MKNAERDVPLPPLTCGSCGFDSPFDSDPFTEFVSWRARQPRAPAALRAVGRLETANSMRHLPAPYAKPAPTRRKRRHREPANRGGMERGVGGLCVKCIAFHAGEACVSTLRAFEPCSVGVARDVAARYTEQATLCLVNAAVFAHSNPGGHVEQAERISHCIDACLDLTAATSSTAASPPSSAANAATGAAVGTAPLHVCTVDVPVPSPSAARAARSSYAAPLQGLRRLGSVSLKQLQFTLSFVHSARYLRSLCARAARSAELGALVALHTRPALLGAGFDASDASDDACAAQQSGAVPAGIRGCAQAQENAAMVGDVSSTAAAAAESSATPLASSSAPACIDCQCKEQCGKYDPRAKNISVRQLKSGPTMYEVTGPCSNYKPKKPKAIAKRKRENNRQPLGRFPCLAEAIAWSTVRTPPSCPPCALSRALLLSRARALAPSAHPRHLPPASPFPFLAMRRTLLDKQPTQLRPSYTTTRH